MTDVKIEQIGGLAGFGGTRLKSWGAASLDEFSSADRAAIEALFLPNRETQSPEGADRFNYRVTMDTTSGSQTIVAQESEVPAALKAILRTRLE